MVRPSIARELAQEQTLHMSGRHDSNTEFPLSPTILARTTMKSWMEKEDKRKAKGDGTGVHLTTVIQKQGQRSYDLDEKTVSH